MSSGNYYHEQESSTRPVNETTSLTGDNNTTQGPRYEKASLRNSKQLAKYEAYTPTTAERVCCCVYRRYELNQGQVYALNEAREQCSILFDKENESHTFFVIKLWEKLFPGEELDKTTLKSKKWQTIGFQNVDPSTDFRGGGLMAARNLLYFAQNYPDDLARIRGDCQGYLFAASCVNLTYFIAHFYRINKNSQYVEKNAKYANLKALNAFSTILRKEGCDAIHELHALMAIHMHRLYLRAARNPDYNMLQFKEVLDGVKRYMIQLAKEAPKTIQELQVKGDFLNSRISS